MTRAVPLLTFVAVALAVTLPVLAHLHLPMVDLPNHIARHHIAATSGTALDQYYEYTYALVPNSAVDFLWWVLGHPMDPYRFSQLTIAFYALNFVASVMVLSRVLHGKWSAWPAASGLLVFNACFFWGFQNYLFTVPFAIYGLSLWLATEPRPVWQRLALFVPLAFGLYLMHFFGFVVLLAAAFGREAQRLIASGSGWPRHVLKAAPLGLPFALPVGHLLHQSLTGPEREVVGITKYGNPLETLQEAVVSTFNGPNTLAVPGLMISGIVGLGVMVLLFLTLRRQTGPRLILVPVMYGPLSALAVICVLAPQWLNGVALVNIRFFFVAIGIAMAASVWTGLTRKSGTVLAISIAAIIGLRGVQVETLARVHNDDVKAVLALLEDVPAGARLLTVRGDEPNPDWRRAHIGAYAVPERNAFAPTLFQGVHAIRLNAGWQDHAHPQAYALDHRALFSPGSEYSRAYFSGLEMSSDARFWEDWEAKFTHMLVFGTLDGDPAETAPVSLIRTMGAFTLYEILVDGETPKTAQVTP